MENSFKFGVLLSLALLGGCNTDSYQRNEGVTSYAGDAIAANSVMQMADPWMEGVEDTNLDVPAERPVATQAEAPKQDVSTELVTTK